MPRGTQVFRRSQNPAYARAMDKFTATLALLRPEELEPCWRLVRLHEREGEMDSAEAQRWRDGIFGLMRQWGLEPVKLDPTDED